MQGKIIKGIAGFYYVHTAQDGESRIYECRAKGILRKEKIKPLVGDNVEFSVLDEKELTGNVTNILPRKNELIRPAVANIDQALVIFAAARPEPNLNLLDRFLIMMGKEGIPCVICFNKQDIAQEDASLRLADIYRSCGYRVLRTSAETREGMERIGELITGKTTALAGPSGVGKSSIINRLQDSVTMQTGEISAKIERGKHTTRHTELIAVNTGTYIMDTPGFSSLGIFAVDKEELKQYYPEFSGREENCRFKGCVHITEPGCAVKAAMEREEISRQRYENYVLLFEELKAKRKY